MNDFGIDIAGLQGVIKVKLAQKGEESKKARTFLIQDGPGCSPKPGGRKVTGKWLQGGIVEELNSYDFEYVIKNGKEIRPEEKF